MLLSALEGMTNSEFWWLMVQASRRYLPDTGQWQASQQPRQPCFLQPFFPELEGSCPASGPWVSPHHPHHVFHQILLQRPGETSDPNLVSKRDDEGCSVTAGMPP